MVGGLRRNSVDEGGVHGVDEKERQRRRVVVSSAWSRVTDGAFPV